MQSIPLLYLQSEYWGGTESAEDIKSILEIENPSPFMSVVSTNADTPGTNNPESLEAVPVIKNSFEGQ